MSDSISIQRLPVEVDPFRLVDQGRIFDGVIPLSDYPRLSEQLFDGSDGNKSTLTVHLEFTRTKTRLPVVNGQIKAELQLLCQRCLDVKAEPFETTFSVVLVSSDEQAERLQEGFDTWMVEDQKIFLRDFIEDEILLALPLVVSHDDCEPAKELIEALPSEEANTNEDDVKDNPFAALKDLKLN